MKSRWILGGTIALALLIAAQAPNTPPPARVEFANPVRIFSQLKETHALRAEMESRTSAMEKTRQEKTAHLRDLAQQRERLEPDSPRRAELENQQRLATVELQTWTTVTKDDLQRLQKERIKQLFDKITAAIAEVAKQRGTQLVLAEKTPEVPELNQISVDELRVLLSERTLLYGDSAMDITNEVITAMDAKFAAVK
jgi:Skp family chaperone for outer membrane proteins